MKKILRIVIPMLIGLLIYNFSNSGFFLEFTNVNVEALKQRFSEVHFVGGGNNFGGASFWLETKGLPIPQELEYGAGASYQKKSCKTQIKGIYYNGQRGLRLRPLDQDTLTLMRANPLNNYSNLNMSGGFFRDCTTISGSNSGDSMYSIYGMITYVLSDGSSEKYTSYMVAGAKLDLNKNIMITGTANNFQYFNNTTPMGYFYDTAGGGIGFIGGTLIGHDNLITFLNSGKSINDAFSISGLTIVSRNQGSTGRILTTLTGVNTAQDTLWNLLIQGTVGLSKSIDSQQRLSLLGNQEKRTIILGGSEINSSTILNLAKKNAQTLCRGKAAATSLIKNSILCYKNGDVTINLASTNYQNSTIIVDSGNVILSATMKGTDTPVEIFINKGNLYIEDLGSNTISFNKDGYPDSTSNAILSGTYLKGNFIINGLMLGGTPGNEAGINHKLHIEGKVVSLNSPTPPAKGRIDQVASVLGNTGFENWINLENVFSWYCNFQGQGSDLTPCSVGGAVSLVPFVVLNGNFPGNLLK